MMAKQAKTNRAVAQDKALRVMKPEDWRQARRRKGRSKRYFVVAVLCYGLIAGMVFLYLQQAPVYSSSMALVMPGSGSSSSFNIEEVGQANSQTKSPFAGGSFSPRVNYKEILKSREVLSSAGEKLGLDVQHFGQPKIKLTQQTSIIDVELRAGNAEQAQSKAWALYQSLQEQLDELRADEAMRRDQSIEKVLEHYRARLNTARRALIDFQQNAMLVEVEQLAQHTRKLSELDSKVLYAQAELKQGQDFVQQLGFDLGVSPALAGKAFALQTDTQFRGHIRELDASAEQVSAYRAKWGLKHPKVKASEQRLRLAQQFAFERSAQMLGDVLASSLQSLNLEASPDRARLFADLIDRYAEVQGQKAQLAELEAAKQKLDDRVRILAREAKELERYQRDYDLAEAVYTSAAARLQAGKADVFASYPPVQMLTTPSLATKQRSPNMKVAIVALAAGVILVSFCLFMLWQRQKLVKKLLRTE